MKKNHLLIRAFFMLPGISYLTEFFIWKIFPPSTALNGVLGGLWTLGQIGILFILFHVYQSFIGDGKKIKMAGVLIAGAGAVSYAINYVFGYWLGMNTRPFLPAGALLTGIGMIVTGIQVLRAKKLKRIGRFAPLLVGLYPFLVMFPLLMITGHPSLLAILGWGIPWFLLGITMNRSGHYKDV
jgi:hypothetical protein